MKDNSSPPIPMLDLTREWGVIGSKLESRLKKVLASGSFILGDYLAEFEWKLGTLLNGESPQHFAVGCASGTDAIFLALKAFGIGHRHKVLTVANTCVPTAAGIRMTGAQLELIDPEPLHLMMDPQRLEVKLAKGDIDAVIAVNLYGNTPPLDRIFDICRKFGVKMVEDCAQSLGARFKGRPAGSFGHIAAFSFYPSKNLGAYGDGGAVFTSDEGLSQRIRRLRNYGYDQERRDWALEEGINSRMDEIQAAILSVKIDFLEEWNERRRAIASRYDEVLRKRNDIHPVSPWEGCLPSRHLYVIRSSDRPSFRNFLEKRGIQIQIHYPSPLHIQPAFEALGYKKGEFPISEKACEEVLSIPLHPFLTDEEIDRVLEALENYIPEEK